MRVRRESRLTYLPHGATWYFIDCVNENAADVFVFLERVFRINMRIYN